MKFKCPKCQTPIYSRRHKTCGQCGAALPVELLFTKEQIRVMDEERKREKQRARDLDLSSGSDGSMV